ncbi:hypothetical protein CEXT_597261 [Caerostris extrusa]|uniref:Uncharacterized protein n=1 Tax=Caerostris extrusa TaxID=172846 RepID=A0AAV4Q9C0_CAEEX|nr:hypothetical protein CEXT_597261 [Caerostris extrusa]
MTFGHRDMTFFLTVLITMRLDQLSDVISPTRSNNGMSSSALTFRILQAITIVSKKLPITMGLDQLSDVTPARSNHSTIFLFDDISHFDSTLYKPLRLFPQGLLLILVKCHKSFGKEESAIYIEKLLKMDRFPLGVPITMRLDQLSDVTPARSNFSSSLMAFRTLTRHLTRHYIYFLRGCGSSSSDVINNSANLY